MGTPRAFIAGVGVVSPAGVGAAAALEAMHSGASGLGPLSLFATSGESAPLVGEVAGFLTEDPTPRTHRLALAAARQALGAGPPPDAIVLGGTTGGMPTTEQLIKHGECHPASCTWHGTGTVADYVAGKVGCAGPVLTVSTACSSGAVALKTGLELIRTGRASRVLAGGADALCRLTFYGFCMLQLVDPNGTRPLDVNRLGMTVGEGAALLLLVAAEQRPEAGMVELLGGGLSCDAYHPSAPHPDGAGALAAMNSAIADAGVGPGDIDYINLHGTGTRDNDIAEARALHTLFGPAPPLHSSTKGAFGHSLGAAGAVEAAVTVLSLQHDLVPANTGCSEPDPALELQPVLKPRKVELRYALSNSFGFGGNNASVVFGRFDSPRPALTPRAGTRFEIVGRACISGVGHTEESVAAFGSGGSVAGVLDVGEVTRGLPPRALRRMQRMPRITLALASAAVAQGGEDAQLRSVFLGTGWGCLSETHRFLDKLFKTEEKFASPTDFVGSVHNAVAGQVAIRFGATGANVTTTGGDFSFEHALFMAGLLSAPGELALVLGADEAHPELTAVFDTSAALAGSLSDGGGALLLRASQQPSSASLAVPYMERFSDPEQAVGPLLEALGGPARVRREFGAIFVGIPAASRELGDELLARFVTAAAFTGPVVDYRRFTGEYATAAATATVLATELVSAADIPASLAGGRACPLGGRGILMLSLGAQTAAVEVGP